MHRPRRRSKQNQRKAAGVKGRSSLCSPAAPYRIDTSSVTTRPLEPIPSRWISWHHPGWYFLILLNIVIYAIVAMVIRKRQKIAPGLCSRHRRLRRTFLTIGWVGFFLGFALVPIGLSADAVGLVLLGPLVLLVSLIVGILGSRIVYPARITKEEIRLKGCGVAFLDSLQG